MASSKDSGVFEYRSFQDIDSIGKYLRALADGFEQGRLSFRSGESELQVTPEGLLDFGIKVKEKNGHVKISLKLDWDEVPSRRNSNKLFIESTEC